MKDKNLKIIVMNPLSKEKQKEIIAIIKQFIQEKYYS